MPLRIHCGPVWKLKVPLEVRMDLELTHHGRGSAETIEIALQLAAYRVVSSFDAFGRVGLEQPVTAVFRSNHMG
jgi:hypothetical protein